jgi:N-acetylglucosamine malate deacetylase 1
MSVEVLFFGAHPDDIEWGAGGIALLLKQAHVAFALIDLTRGELGSRGTPAERNQEAEHAAQFLGNVPRENLDLPDCHLIDSPDTRILAANAIRRFRPSIVIAPFWKDRHPDHAATGQIVRNARLFCTLKKSASPHPPHKPKLFLYYPLHHSSSRYSFVADISGIYPKKLELLRLHASQFAKTAEQFGVVSHGLGDYLFALESRDRYFGTLIGTRHGEALIADGPLPISNLIDLLRLKT